MDLTCETCKGRGWIMCHGPGCYDAERVGGERCPEQRRCHDCTDGRRPHDADCEHFREAVDLVMTVMQQDERIERLEAVVTEARNVLEAYDQADPMADWTGAMVDTRLRTAIAALDQETSDG